MAFKRYSKSIGKEAIQAPIPWRSWDDLDKSEKYTILLHIKKYYDYEPHYSNDIFDKKLKPIGESILSILKKTIITINSEYKYELPAKSYPEYEENKYLIIDFENIIKNYSGNWVYELLSIWLNTMSESLFSLAEKELNDTFEQFGINMMIVNDSFVPRQDDYIIEELYIPVLSFLSDEKRESVEKNVKIILESYRNKEYDKANTLIQTTLESYMSILLGSSDTFGKLLSACISKRLIPENLRKFESYFQEVRKSAGIAHSNNSEKKIDAGECLTAINFMIIFLQACIQYIPS